MHKGTSAIPHDTKFWCTWRFNLNPSKYSQLNRMYTMIWQNVTLSAKPRLVHTTSNFFFFSALPVVLREWIFKPSPESV